MVPQSLPEQVNPELHNPISKNKITRSLKILKSWSYVHIFENWLARSLASWSMPADTCFTSSIGWRGTHALHGLPISQMSYFQDF
jgi:hypothetical protein